jgi:type II secretion system protein N
MAPLTKIFSWLASFFAYLLYTAAVLIILLWLLFPAGTVKLWLESRLNTINPSLQWEISELRMALPLNLVATSIRLEGDDRPVIFEVDELKLRPDIPGLLAFNGTVPLHFQARLLDGTVTGQAVMSEGMLGMNSQGEIANLELGMLTALWRKLGRSFTGRISGPFSYQGNWNSFADGTFHADAVVSPGSMDLMQPFFGLERFEYSRLVTTVDLENREMVLREGQVDSRMLAASYSGTITLADPLLLSDVRIDGTMEPRPELLGRLQDEKAVTLIRNQLQNNRLSFSISGTLLEPGIVFQGNSGVIDGIIRAGGSQ